MFSPNLKQKHIEVVENEKTPATLKNSSVLPEIFDEDNAYLFTFEQVYNRAKNYKKNKQKKFVIV